MAVSVAVQSQTEKLFYRIQEVAQLTGIKPHVLRYWETEFRQLAPRKDANDQRRYTKADIDLILQIKKLLYEERFTIAGAKKRLRQEPASDPREVADEDAPVIHLDNIRALRRDISELLSLLDKRRPAAA